MRPKLKSVFFGTPDFALPSLKATYENSEILAVISQPDKARGRGKKVSPSAVKAWIQEQSPQTPVHTPLSLRKTANDPASKNCLDFLRACPADLFVVTAYGNILPQAILDLPKLACINVHASLLPRWRGAAPIQRALEAGDHETGISLQKMLFKLDAGHILKEAKLSIHSNSNALLLSEELSQLSEGMLKEFLEELSEAPAPQKILEGRPQDEALVTYAHKITKEEAYWSEAWSATEFHNKCRAFRAWPQVEALLKDPTGTKIPIKILKTQMPSEELSQKIPPLKAGHLHHLPGQVFVGSQHPKSPLELLEIKAPGKGGAPAFQVLENIGHVDKKTGQSDCCFLEH